MVTSKVVYGRMSIPALAALFIWHPSAGRSENLPMLDVIALTRQLVDIPSMTPEEDEVGKVIEQVLRSLTQQFDGHLELMEVEPGRRNVLARFGEPLVTLSTHMDTVPPFIPSSEDLSVVRGRGSCDAKGIIAAMICAAERLLHQGTRNFALLAVVGEERNSAGARYARTRGIGSRYLINGEPTSNQLASGTKGSLRYEVEARGRCAHSAYPHLGESAIDKLLDALQALRSIIWPVDPILGRGTMNIGTIRGGRAPNVIPDEALAEVHIRLVDDGQSSRDLVHLALAEHPVEVREILCIPAVHLQTLPGWQIEVMAYTTDIPAFGGAWGQPLLIGPGTIHVAHTPGEHIAKKELQEAVDVYARLVRELQAGMDLEGPVSPA
jgi:acetylornithine deacetylase